ncbi:MAG TPA: NAD-dependent epimerase/dehydratase family protein, partial [Gemmatimonadales bacterium]
MNSRSSAPCQRCSGTILTSGGARQKRQTGRFPAVGPNQEHALQIAITGASGLIGSALTRRLSPEHRITPLVRKPPGAGEIRWDPEAGTLDPAALAGVEAVIHLAGEDIA